jgi:hypothetical protein
MNKMVINHLEKLFVTSDASTIVTEMDVYHPAAKLLVMAAKAQAGEVGDATNLVSRVQGRCHHLPRHFESEDFRDCWSCIASQQHAACRCVRW